MAELAGRERRAVALDRTEAPGQSIEHPVVEPRPDLPGINQLVPPVMADQQGPEPASRLYPFLGSYLLAEAVDRAGADLVLHGHAHRGQEQGVTPGGVPIRNVGQHVIRRPYKLFSFGADGADGHGEEDHSEARAAQSSA